MMMVGATATATVAVVVAAAEVAMAMVMAVWPGWVGAGMRGALAVAPPTTSGEEAVGTRSSPLQRASQRWAPPRSPLSASAPYLHQGKGAPRTRKTLG